MSQQLQTTQPAAVAKKTATLESILTSDKFQESLQKYASRIDPRVFASVALTQVRKNPKLLQCTQISVLSALSRCAELCVTPDGYYAHLIPQRNNKIKDERGNWGVMECRLSIDYKGLVMLTFRNGDMSEPITADVVRKNDTFRHAMGRVLEHTYDLDGDRGTIIGVWAIARFIQGGERHVILNRHQIARARKASQLGADGPWGTDEEEMTKKTAVRNLCKYIPLTPEQAKYLEDERQGEEPRELPTRPAVLNQLDAELGAPPVAELPPAEEPLPVHVTKILDLVDEIGREAVNLLGKYGFEEPEQVPEKASAEIITALNNMKKERTK